MTTEPSLERGASNPAGPTTAPSLDDLLAALPERKTPESEGLPPLTPEGLLAFVKANLNEHDRDSGASNAGGHRTTPSGVCNWDTVVTAYEKADCTADDIDDTLNEAMDRGLLFEPLLGQLAVGFDTIFVREAPA